MSATPKIVIVCGATASGKTAFSIDLAERLGGEIVGADSLQLYRYLDVGTAKPTPEERARVPHHLIDVLSPDEPFNAALYKRMADHAIAGIIERGRLPIVVGGTGLYLRILVRGIFEAPQPDDELRERLRSELETYGVEYLYKRLQLVDEVLARKVEPHDRNRIMRGLEIYEQTGIALSEHQRAHDFADPDYEALSLGVRIERHDLYERIGDRTRRMIDDGLEAECRALAERGYSTDLKPMESLGYRQMFQYIAGKGSLESTIYDIIKDTKRYAKRQLTWFRKVGDVHWVSEPETKADAIASDVRTFLAGEPPDFAWQTEPP